MEVFFKEIENQKNFQIFDENHGLAPLQKWTLPTMLKLYLWSQESLFSHLEQYYTSCLGIFQRKWDSKELSNIWWKLWVNPFAKMDIVPLCWSDVFEVKKVFFSHLEHYVWVFFKENETQMNFQIVHENHGLSHGLTPLEKWTFSQCF